MSQYLLFDIGASKTRLARSPDLEKFEEPAIFETIKDYDMAIEKIVSIASKICSGQITAVAGGVPGALDKEKKKIISAGNLKTWIGKPFATDLEEKLKTKVYIENDTGIVGLGEAVFGSGKDHNIIGYITISTGVNGVKIVNKHFTENAFGIEIGRQIIDYINFKNLEDLISGREMQKKFGKHPKEIKDTEVWNEVAKNASIGVFNTILHWSPSAVIIGGAMMNDIPIEVIREEVSKLLEGIFPEKPKIIKAALGDIGGLYGALHYLKNISSIEY